MRLAVVGAGAVGRSVVELAGGSAKFRRFHDSLRQAGITRPFEGRLESWSYAPLEDTARAAAEVARRIEARRAADRAPGS